LRFLALPTCDPKDLLVLECAIAAQADVIISGDEDLLTLKSFQGIPVINPSEALRRIGLEGN
jgi:predicted nucleic acid-binding protein